MEFPIQSIPKYTYVTGLHRNDAKTSKICTVMMDNTDTLRRYLKSAMRITDGPFGEANNLSGLTTDRKGVSQVTHRSASHPIPQNLSTLNHKYEIICPLTEGLKTQACQFCKIKDMSTKIAYVAKIQGRKRSKYPELDINRERNFLLSILSKQSKNSQLARLFDMGYDNHFKFLILEDTGRDMMFMHSNFKPFDAVTSFMLTYFSFQAIRELHTLEHLHLDLRPSSFHVTFPFHLKIVDFFRVTPLKSKPRVTSAMKMDRFSPRVFCRKDEELDELADFESWIYVIMFLTCETPLPWINDKENMNQLKEALFKNPTDLMSIEAMSYDDNSTPQWGDTATTLVIPQRKTTSKGSGKKVEKKRKSKKRSNEKVRKRG